MTQIRTLSFAVAALCAAAIAQPVAAQAYTLHPGFSLDSSQVVTYAKVPYPDGGIGSTAGARTLLERIEAAAEAVCGGGADLRSAYARADYESCRKGAIAQAVVRTHSPVLAALTSRRATELRAAR